jgi:hypothetical protein
MNQLRDFWRFRLRTLFILVAVAGVLAWAKGTVLKQLRLGPTRGDIVQVDFSPDGQLLAVAMNNGAVVILRSPWD